MLKYVEIKGKKYPAKYSHRAKRMLREHLAQRNKDASAVESDEMMYYCFFAGCKADGMELDFSLEDLIDWMDDDYQLEKLITDTAQKFFAEQVELAVRTQKQEELQGGKKKESTRKQKAKKN